MSKEVLYCVKQLQFEHIEEYWTSFWQPEDDLEDEEWPTDYPLFDDALPPLPPMSLNQQYIISNRQSEQIYDQKFTQQRSIDNRQVPSMGNDMLEIDAKSMLI
ncbi:hypothetical protein OSTOST_03789 [Ostertagia ostertagi]